jgi:formiminotetrahydrofolate cyclodeaminase
MGREAFFREAETSSMAQLLEALAAPGAPAAGTALAYVGSMAAALGLMCLRGVADSRQVDAVRSARDRFVALAGRDARAYEAYQTAEGHERADAAEEAIAIPLAIAREARGLWDRLAPHRGAIPAARGEDLRVALDLLGSVVRGAARLAQFNAQASGRASTTHDREARALADWVATVTL